MSTSDVDLCAEGDWPSVDIITTITSNSITSRHPRSFRRERQWWPRSAARLSDRRSSSIRQTSTGSAPRRPHCASQSSFRTRRRRAPATSARSRRTSRRAAAARSPATETACFGHSSGGSPAQRNNTWRSELLSPVATCWLVNIIVIIIVKSSSGFVKQEQWERCQYKRKLVSGSKHRGRFCESSGYYPPPQNFEIACAKSCNQVHFLSGNWFEMLSIMRS